MWDDLSATVAEKRVKFFNPADPQVDNSSFRSLLHSFMDDAHACFRWSVCAHDELSFSLDLQGLPVSATATNSKQAVCVNTAPTIQLASLGIEFPSFPGEYHIPGPAPRHILG